VSKKLLNRKILICGVWYKITSHKFEEGDWGSCTFHDKSIFLSEDITDDQRLITAMHEITHAILREKKIDDKLQDMMSEAYEAGKEAASINMDEMALEIEEEICEAMEVGYKAFKNI
jgi:Zn-dependent peptidase ImmA (M78 family)